MSSFHAGPTPNAVGAIRCCGGRIKRHEIAAGGKHALSSVYTAAYHDCKPDLNGFDILKCGFSTVRMTGRLGAIATVI